MTKVFDKALMASEDVQAYVGSCKFGTGTGANFVGAAINDGAFVTLGALALDHTYGTASIDYNVYEAAVPATGALTREDIVVVDIAGIAEGVIGGNTYKIGAKLTDLVGQADYAVRFRRLMKGDKFWLGAGNFESAPTVGEFATVVNGKTTLTPADEADDDALSVKILLSKALTIGQTVGYASSAYEQLYLCEVL